MRSSLVFLLEIFLHSSTKIFVLKKLKKELHWRANQHKKHFILKKLEEKATKTENKKGTLLKSKLKKDSTDEQSKKIRDWRN